MSRITGLDCAHDALDEPYNRFRLRTHCLVTSVHSNKISSLVQSPVEMKAFFCDETNDAELVIDTFMLAARQHYKPTLLTPSRPNVGPNLPSPSSTLRRSTRFQAPPLFHTRVVTTPLGYFQWQSCIFMHLENKFSCGGNKFTRGGNK